MVDAADPVLEGDEIAYVMTVSNSGPDTALNVLLTDQLPDGVTYISATPTQGSCAEEDGVVTCGLGDLASGSSAAVELVVSGATAGLITNEALVSADGVDPDLSGNSATEETTIAQAPEPEPEADLGLIMEDSADPVSERDEVTYMATVTNAGPDGAVNVVLSERLPEGATFVSATASQGSCTVADGVLTCALGDLASGAGATVELVLVADVAGLLPNEAVVSSDTPDPSLLDNQAIQETTVEPGSESGPEGAPE
jgi:uncharacterized repeat protein (TIGR01451 family)